MKTNMVKVLVCDENYNVLGAIPVTHEEAEHFTSTGSCMARTCMDSTQIDLLGIHEEDYVYLRSA